MLYLFLVNSRDSTASNKLLSFRVRISQLCLEVLAIATAGGARTQSFTFILLGFVFPHSKLALRCRLVWKRFITVCY